MITQHRKTRDLLDIAARACYYGKDSPDTDRLHSEWVLGIRIVSIVISPKYGRDVCAVLSGRVYPGDLLSIDVFYTLPGSPKPKPLACGSVLRTCIRGFKQKAMDRGVKYVYTLVHDANPQAARLMRFYTRFMGFEREAVRLMVSIEGIRDL